MAIEYAPAEVNPEVDPEAAAINNQVALEDSLAPGEEIVNTAAPPVYEQFRPQQSTITGVTTNPLPVADSPSTGGNQSTVNIGINQNRGGNFELAASEAAAKSRAQAQKTLSARRNVGNNSDWRFKIKLAPNSNYLYTAESPGILAPLREKGVIFPYTPQIETQYTARYDSYDLIHSNYRGYFYKNSSVNEISVLGTFTAQDTVEAQYLLAVIHFFRSVTKMFYGKDPQAGIPPPLVYASGYGPYQFNDHACLVSNFTYSLPSDVDYIRADAPNQIGVNLENRTGKTSGIGVTGPFTSIVNRLKNANLFSGALPKLPNPNFVLQNVNTPNATNATYVPTKMDINIQLLPVQTRSQVSQQFSLEGFANGRLLRGGFW